MKKIIVISVLALALLTAFVSKPDNKTCIIEGVKAVWGNMTPNPYDKPELFEMFMNINSKNVKVNDWVFFKQVVYTSNKQRKTVGLAAFKKMFVLVRPVELGKASAAPGEVAVGGR